MRAVVALRVFGATLVAAACGAVWFVTDVTRFMQTPMNVPVEGYVLLVEPGETLTGVADRLAAESLLTHPRYLVGYARWHERDRRIQAGEYRVPPESTPERLLKMMERGEVVRHQVRLIEGWTWRRALAEIQSHPLITVTIESPDEVARLLDLPAPDPEGWFLPATYDFRRGSTDIALLETAHRAMVELLESAWSERGSGLPYRSPYEALILASIVEKETAVAKERPRVAGVFVRRLQKGMRLEADPTVIYGLGERFDGNLTRRDLRGGLPPTPIALPGAAALDAALHPADGADLFFVATGEGGHVFSATFSEHRKAVDRWQRRRRGTDENR